MRSILKIASIICLLMTFSSCVTEIIPEPSPTKLGVNVYNDKSEIIYGVSVYLFDNELDFTKAKTTGNVSNRIKEGITENNSDSVSLVFENLNYNADYYIYVSYRDRERYVDLDNFSSSFLVKKEIIFQETTSLIRVNLSPAKSSVSFFSNSATSNQFPIKIFLANDSVGTLTDNISGSPLPSTTSGVLNYKLSTGDTWFAKSAGGCFWAGNIELDGTESFQAIKLEECDAGAMSFWLDDSNSDLLPIKITLNGLDEIGTLTRSGEVTECFSNKGLSVGRKAGSYTYTAKSLSKGCDWTGVINLTVGDCNIIELTPCN